MPWAKVAALKQPSRTDLTVKDSARALTALVPTPFSPTENSKTSLPYFAPVLIRETQSTTFPKGIPRP